MEFCQLKPLYITIAIYVVLITLSRYHIGTTGSYKNAQSCVNGSKVHREPIESRLSADTAYLAKEIVHFYSILRGMKGSERDKNVIVISERMYLGTSRLTRVNDRHQAKERDRHINISRREKSAHNLAHWPLGPALLSRTSR